MKSRKSQITEGIKLPDQERTRTFGENKNYKYLGTLEVDTIKQAEVKEIKKIVPHLNKKFTRNRALHSKVHQRDNLLGSTPLEYIRDHS